MKTIARVQLHIGDDFKVLKIIIVMQRQLLLISVMHASYDR